MKIYVIKAKTCIKYIIAVLTIAGIILMVDILLPDITGVFSNERELPIYSVDCTEKVVSITFDCAWGADDIPDILNTLKKEDVKATFFIVGQWAEKFPETIEMISEEGHDIANHSYSHLRMSVLDNERAIYEISMCGKKLKETTGNTPDLFRAPYGDYSNSVIKTAKSLGYYSIQWDVDSLDWKPGIAKEEIINRVMKKVKPGSIILFHNDTALTARILPEIILTLKKEGYGYIPVSKMIMRDNYIIDFEGRQKRKE